MEIDSNLKNVFKGFVPQAELLDIVELSAGHINDTYLVTTESRYKYILQKVNKIVFKDVEGLIRNKVNICNHLSEKMTHMTELQRRRHVLTFLSTPEGHFYVTDPNGEFWTATFYIDHSQNFQKVPNADIAYQGGKLFGSFLNLTSDFDASALTEVIPGFHDMSQRFQQFEGALKNASSDRVKRARTNIEMALNLKEEMHILQKLKETGQIRTRVTHNDTKISNALFDERGVGLCVIDTDTVMPGIIHYDFGDAIRTICNTAEEDEKDKDKIKFNKGFYEAYSDGFLGALGETVSGLERQYLPLAAKTMIFIMALRFLTDYLNNDIYYKTKFPEHNLVRSSNQFQLIRSFDEVMGKVS